MQSNAIAQRIQVLNDSERNNNSTEIVDEDADVDDKQSTTTATTTATAKTATLRSVVIKMRFVFLSIVYIF